MAKFKKGDKVVRRTQWQGGERDDQWSRSVYAPDMPKSVRMCDNWVVEFDDVSATWDTDKFELYVEPQPEPVTVTEPAVQQIAGVPDGYRLVRIGAPKKGEQFIGGYNILSKADVNMYDYAWAIVEPIIPPAPPISIPTTVKVQLNRYLVGTLGGVTGMRIVVGTQEWVDTFHREYRLLGPSETLELEVEVQL